MAREQWTTVDRYFIDLFVPPDPVLEAALQAAADAGLPPINVAPNQGKLLAILRSRWGRAPFLRSARSAATARSGWRGRCRLTAHSLPWRPTPRMPALLVPTSRAPDWPIGSKCGSGAPWTRCRSSPQIDARPFDLVFIDADKPSYTAYLDWALKLTRRGSLIIADNIVRNGAVVDANSDDQNVQGVRRFNAALAAEARVTATGIQTVGVKGYDGLAIALVIGG